MKFIFNRNFVYDNLLSPVMVSIVALLLMQAGYQFTNHDFGKNVNKASEISSQSSTVDTGDHLYLIPGDITPSSCGERRESFQNGPITVKKESIKFIRCLFGIDESALGSLLGDSIWYSSLGYQFNLPPEWSPSISIAYRKLLI